MKRLFPVLLACLLPLIVHKILFLLILNKKYSSIDIMCLSSQVGRKRYSNIWQAMCVMRT